MKGYIKIENKIVKCVNIEFKKQTFPQNNRPILIKNLDINKIVVSNKVSFGKKESKYFIGYKETKNRKPLSIFLPKISVYGRNFDETKCMSFLIKDYALLEI